MAFDSVRIALIIIDPCIQWGMQDFATVVAVAGQGKNVPPFIFFLLRNTPLPSAAFLLPFSGIWARPQARVRGYQLSTPGIVFFFKKVRDQKAIHFFHH